MSVLPSGQFLDYSIIAVVASVLAGILNRHLEDKVATTRRRVLVFLSFSVMAGLAHVALTKFIPADPAIRVVIDNFPGVSTKSPTPTSLPSPTPVLASPKPEEGNPVDAFLSMNVSPPRVNTRKPGQWAVVLAGPEGGEIYPQLATSVSSVISAKGQSSVAIFRPSITRTSNFETLFAADPDLDRKLGRYCDYVFAGKITSSTTQNPQLADLISVSLILNARIISTKSGGVDGQFEAQAVGAGVNLDEARSNAGERLAAQVRSQLQALIK